VSVTSLAPVQTGPFYVMKQHTKTYSHPYMNWIWAYSFSVWCFPNETDLRSFGSKIL